MDSNSDNLNNPESKIESIGNEKLLNDFVDIKYQDGLKGVINNSLDTTKTKLSLGKELELGINDNSILGDKIQDDSILGDKILNNTIKNEKLKNSTIEVIAGTNLTGGGVVSLGESVTLGVESSLGKVRQFVTTDTSTYITTASIIPSDDTIPQNTEGAQMLTLTITPTDASNNLVMTFSTEISNSVGNATVTIALFQDATVSATYSMLTTIGFNNNTQNIISFQIVVPAVNISARTYKIRFGGNTGTTAINGYPGTRLQGGALAAWFNIVEVGS